MERPLITLTVFVSAILLGYSPLIVDSLGPNEPKSGKSTSPAATKSAFSKGLPHSRPGATRQTGNKQLSHSKPPLPKTGSSHSPPPLPKSKGSHPPPLPKTKSLPTSHPVPLPEVHPSPLSKGRPVPRPNGKGALGKPKANVGKKIGLLFAVIAGSLQVGVVLFLGIKRWQIMKEET